MQWKQKAKALDEEFAKAKTIIAASKNAKDVARIMKELEQARAELDKGKSATAAAPPATPPPAAAAPSPALAEPPQGQAAAEASALLEDPAAAESAGGDR